MARLLSNQGPLIERHLNGALGTFADRATTAPIHLDQRVVVTVHREGARLPRPTQSMYVDHAVVLGFHPDARAREVDVADQRSEHEGSSGHPSVVLAREAGCIVPTYSWPMDPSDISAKADDLGRKADDSDLFDHAVRVGLVSYGVVHLLIAWLALQLALGDSAGSASGSGALHELAQKPFGAVLLWIAGAGFFVLVLWKLSEALLGHRDEDGARRVFKRATSTGKAIVYGTLGASALKVAIGAGGSGSGTDTLSSRLMAMPFGALLVGAVGVAVLVVAGVHIYQGFTERFREKLEAKGKSGESGKFYIRLGKVGYVSKGLALAVIGGLFVYAAWTHDPKKSGGFDQALKTVLDQPFGSPLLIVMAAGLASFGLFCFAWARHLDR